MLRLGVIFVMYLPRIIDPLVQLSGVSSAKRLKSLVR